MHRLGRLSPERNRKQEGGRCCEKARSWLPQFLPPPSFYYGKIPVADKAGPSRSKTPTVDLIRNPRHFSPLRMPKMAHSVRLITGSREPGNFCFRTNDPRFVHKLEGISQGLKPDAWAVFGTSQEAAEERGMSSKIARANIAGAEAHVGFARFAARLKSWPYYKAHPANEFSAACKVVPLLQGTSRNEFFRSL